MDKRIVVVAIIVFIGVSGFTVAQTLETRKQTYNLDVQCTKEQYIWECPCSDKINMTYEKLLDNYTQDGITYVTYMPVWNIGQCTHKELVDRTKVLNPRDTDIDIKNAMGKKLRDEYLSGTKIVEKQYVKGRGEINVTK